MKFSENQMGLGGSGMKQVQRNMGLTRIAKMQLASVKRTGSGSTGRKKMFELRRLVPAGTHHPDEDRLQFRYSFEYDLGTLTATYWSDWEDIPTVVEGEYDG